MLLLLCGLLVITVQASEEKREWHVQNLYDGACLYAQTGNLKEAIVYYHAAINYYGAFKIQEPADMPLKIWTQLGKVYKLRYLLKKDKNKEANAQTNLVQAFTCFKKAALRKYYPAIVEYGALLTKFINIDDADESLKKICDQNAQPDVNLNELRINISLILKETWARFQDKQDLEHAFVWLKKAADQGNVEAIEQQGLLYMASGELKQAEERLSMAIKKDYNLGSNLYNIGLCRQAMKDYQGAVRVWQMAVNLEKHVQAAWALGHYYKKIGQREEALQWFNKAAEYRTDD